MPESLQIGPVSFGKDSPVGKVVLFLMSQYEPDAAFDHMLREDEIYAFAMMLRDRIAKEYGSSATRASFNRIIEEVINDYCETCLPTV